MKTHREKLEEIGGWENGMVSVPASAVREIIIELEWLQHRYQEIIMQVQNKIPDESRHETAVRTIKQHESPKEANCEAAE